MKFKVGDMVRNETYTAPDGTIYKVKSIKNVSYISIHYRNGTSSKLVFDGNPTVKMEWEE